MTMSATVDPAAELAECRQHRGGLGAGPTRARQRGATADRPLARGQRMHGARAGGGDRTAAVARLVPPAGTPQSGTRHRDASRTKQPLPTRTNRPRPAGNADREPLGRNPPESLSDPSQSVARSVVPATCAAASVSGRTPRSAGSPCPPTSGRPTPSRPRRRHARPARPRRPSPAGTASAAGTGGSRGARSCRPRVTYGFSIGLRSIARP